MIPPHEAALPQLARYRSDCAPNAAVPTSIATEPAPGKDQAEPRKNPPDLSVSPLRRLLNLLEYLPNQG